jgi:hypothetical protein
VIGRLARRYRLIIDELAADGCAPAVRKARAEVQIDLLVALISASDYTAAGARVPLNVAPSALRVSVQGGKPTSCAVHMPVTPLSASAANGMHEKNMKTSSALHFIVRCSRFLRSLAT